MCKCGRGLLLSASLCSVVRPEGEPAPISVTVLFLSEHLGSWWKDGGGGVYYLK